MKHRQSNFLLLSPIQLPQRVLGSWSWPDSPARAYEYKGGEQFGIISWEQSVLWLTWLPEIGTCICLELCGITASVDTYFLKAPKHLLPFPSFKAFSSVKFYQCCSPVIIKPPSLFAFSSWCCWEMVEYSYSPRSCQLHLHRFSVPKGPLGKYKFCLMPFGKLGHTKHSLSLLTAML